MNASLSVSGLSMRLRLRASYKLSLSGLLALELVVRWISLRFGFRIES